MGTLRDITDSGEEEKRERARGGHMDVIDLVAPVALAAADGGSTLPPPLVSPPT